MVEKIVHLPRDHADVEQRLDPLASSAREISALIRRIHEALKGRPQVAGVGGVDGQRAGAAHFGETAQS